MEELASHLSNYYHLSNEAYEALSACFEEKVFAKNDYLLREGNVCRHLYFLKKGALRGYYNVDGKDITHWFGFEHDFVTSFHSFITGQPSVEHIQFMEGSIVYAISKEKLNNLFNQYHEIERLVRIAYEKYYIRLEERYVNAQFKTAAALYSNLLRQAPHIIERVPLGYISSYLGITQETLSRIRKQH
jgi:signal-transduction protein with cAMP-binding, CBS, and nucleotidyltransferase domain